MGVVATNASTDKNLSEHTHDDRYYTEAEVDNKLATKAASSHTHNYAGSSSAGGAAITALVCTGNAASATKLTTSRTVQTNLASTSSASFNGTANITPGVTGVLPVANGGTGNTTNDAATLGGKAASAFAAASHTHDYLPLSGGTITGNLRLKGSGNYGNILNFGDGDYIHLSEPTDDKLEIKASNLDFKVSSTTTFSGAISSTGNITTTGNISAANITATGNITGAKVYNAVWSADYAEGFEYDGQIPERGEIIELCGENKVRVASAGSSMVIGVCSDTYWALAGCPLKEIEEKKKVAVGLVGQIRVKVSGSVNFGDYIVCVGNGIGEARSNPSLGHSIGRAMESNSELGIKYVNCLISIR